MNPKKIALSVLIPLASPGVGSESLAIAGKVQDVLRRPAYLGNIGFLPLGTGTEEPFDFVTPEFQFSRRVDVEFEHLGRLAPMPYVFGDDSV